MIDERIHSAHFKTIRRFMQPVRDQPIGLYTFTQNVHRIFFITLGDYKIQITVGK